MFLKLLFAVSLSDLFITIQYAVFRKSLTTHYVSLYIYIHMKSTHIGLLSMISSVQLH